ncbi:hypothetical protein EDD85DRAFT_935963 [Armillaria nabsnona]|nr:hypothetical protein EDD85DRAFT_935963 [Armillaria nabsnona]
MERCINATVYQIRQLAAKELEKHIDYDNGKLWKLVPKNERNQVKIKFPKLVPNRHAIASVTLATISSIERLIQWGYSFQTRYAVLEVVATWHLKYGLAGTSLEQPYCYLNMHLHIQYKVVERTATSLDKDHVIGHMQKYTSNNESQVWRESTNGRNRDKSIDKVTFTAAKEGSSVLSFFRPI